MLHHHRNRSIDAGLLCTDFRKDPVAKRRLKAWLDGIWAAKDLLLVEARKTGRVVEGR